MPRRLLRLRSSDDVRRLQDALHSRTGKPSAGSAPRRTRRQSAEPTPGRRQSGLRDRLFGIVVALTFAALGAGMAAIAPVLSYACRRDAAGAVSCTVHPRMYGMLPLPARELARIVSANVESSTHSTRQGAGTYWRYQTYEVLVVVCADGTEWRSFASTEPLGESNSALARGIQELLTVESPREYHGWTGEKVPLLVGTVFLAPAVLILLALLLRLLVFRGQKAEELTASLRAVAEKRLEAREGWMLAGRQCQNRPCTGVINEQGLCDTCGTPASRR
jgi:hypothetical protein